MFCHCFGFSAAGSQNRVKEKTLRVVSGCLRPMSGATDAFIHRITSIPQTRMLLPCELLWAPLSQLRTVILGLFYVWFRVPKISTNSDQCSSSRLRCRPMLRTRRNKKSEIMRSGGGSNTKPVHLARTSQRCNADRQNTVGNFNPDKISTFWRLSGPSGGGTIRSDIA